MAHTSFIDRCWHSIKSLACGTGLICIGFLAAAQTNAPAQPGGGALPPAFTNAAVLTIEGIAQVSRAGGQAWAAATVEQKLHVGDRVRTGPKGRASVRLADTSVLRLNQLTTIEIQPAEQAGSGPTLNMTAGAAYFFNRGKPTDVPFRTPVA